jgi:uncharacterized delta-60 repeat protein
MKRVRGVRSSRMTAVRSPGVIGAGICALVAACGAFSSGDDAPPPPSADAGGEAGGPTLGKVPIATLIRGRRNIVAVDVQRPDGVPPLRLEASALPTGLTARAVGFAGTSGRVEIEIDVALDVKQGRYDAAIVAQPESGGEPRAVTQLPLFVRGEPGALDTTWAKDGILELAVLEDEWCDLVVQPDGSAFAAVQTFSRSDRVVVRRVLPDGTQDARFGSTGTLTFTGGQGNGLAPSIGFQGASLVVRAGTKVGWFTAEGAVQTVFGTGGTPGVTEIPAQPGVVNLGTRSIAHDRGGRWLVVSSGTQQGGLRAMHITAVGAAGNIDTTFGTDGTVATYLSAATGYVFSTSPVVAEPDGRLLLFGIYSPTGGGGTKNLAAARLLSDGAPDTVLSGDGFARHPSAPPLDVIRAARRTEKGAVLLLADLLDVKPHLLRFDSGGNPDTSFVVDLAQMAQARDLEHVGAERALVAGKGVGGAPSLVRILPNGTADPAFGSLGAYAYNAPAFELHKIRALPDGRVLAGVTLTAGGQKSAAVARFWGD